MRKRLLKKRIFRTVDIFLYWVRVSIGKKGTVRLYFSLHSYRGNDLVLQDLFSNLHRHLVKVDLVFFTVCQKTSFLNRCFGKNTNNFENVVLGTT